MITELDEKKREALGKTWRKVNQDFGSIFSMLLPGTSAKLEPPEGGTFLDGAPHLGSSVSYIFCIACQSSRHRCEEVAGPLRTSLDGILEALFVVLCPAEDQDSGPGSKHMPYWWLQGREVADHKA